MNEKRTNSECLAELWHRLLLYPTNNICTEKLKSASILDVNILRIVNAKELIIIRDIGNILSVGPSTLSSAINRLEKKGLLKRIINEDDLRSYALQLTIEGTKELDNHYNQEIEIMEQMLKKLDSEEEQKQLLFLLDKITSIPK